MNINRSIFLSYILISFQILFSDICIANVQNINTNNMSLDSPRVVWVKNWSSNESKNKSKKFKDRLNLVLFGIKSPKLINPISVFANSIDEFWVLDQGSKKILQIEKGICSIPQVVKKSDFVLSSLVGICSVSNSDLLFSDSHSNKLYKISASKKKLQIFNDTLSLDQPTGIAYLSAKKEIWVIETKAHRIAILNENGELIKRIGSRGIAAGEFNYPTHIWIAKNGYVYINDAMNFRIQVLNSDGEVISVFGEAGDATGYFARPKGIATDSYGNIYVVDALFHAVQVFDIKGNFLYKFGSQGQNNAEFWMPSGIFIDNQNFIYIADTYNSRIQIFQLIQKEKK